MYLSASICATNNKYLPMGFKPIKHNSKGVKPHKAIVSPDFNDKTVLVRNHWDYVEKLSNIKVKN